MHLRYIFSTLKLKEVTKNIVSLWGSSSVLISIQYIGQSWIDVQVESSSDANILLGTGQIVFWKMYIKMYSMLLSASSLCAELIISNSFAFFPMVIIVGTINAVHYISYRGVWIKLSTTVCFSKAWINSHWNNSTCTDLISGWPTFPQFPVLPVHEEGREGSFAHWLCVPGTCWST